MKKKFSDSSKGDIEISVTEVGGKKKIKLKASSIRSLMPTDNNQTRILYRVAEGENDFKEILVEEECGKLVDALNAEPDEETKASMEREIIHERQKEAEHELEIKGREYEREKGCDEREYHQKYNEAIKELENTQQQFNETKERTQSSYRARSAVWLDKKLEKNNERSYYSDPYQKVVERGRAEKVAYWFLTIGAVSTVVNLYKKQDKELKKNKRDIENIVETRKRDKEGKERAFNREKQSLEGMKRNPMLSHEDRARLEKEIREYRLEHGDRERFHFKEQLNGGFENVKSPERRQEQKTEQTHNVRRGRFDRDLERSKSRGPSRGM